MKTFVCLAGFPAEVVTAVGQRSAARFTGATDNQPIIRAIREPYAFRAGMSDFFLDALAKRIEALKILDEVSIVVVYAAYEGAETERFVGTFFPFALCAPVAPFYPDQAPKAQRRSVLMAFVDEVERTVASTRAKARAVRDALSGQPLSPLLLPLRNFKSEIVRPEIQALFGELPRQDDAKARLDSAVAAITTAHPLRRLQNGSRAAYFQDDRTLRFKSPGKDRHGMARALGDGHRPDCLINSRVRLGAPFDTLLHYDCDYGRGNVDRDYPNCHGESQAPAAKTHANIAPSDAVR